MSRADLIFGHTWEAIQRAQQGGRLHECVQTVLSDDTTLLAQSRAMLAEHGLQWLLDNQMHGCLDCLRRHGVVS